MVGDIRAPRPYLDVKIFNRTFQALMNTGSENSSVNLTVVKWVQTKLRETLKLTIEKIEIPIEIKGVFTTVECMVTHDQEDDVQLGTHFLHFHGYQFGFNGLSMDSTKSPIAKTKNEISFVYNLPDHQYLRQYLRRKTFFMKQDKALEAPTKSDENNNRIVILRK